MFADELRREIQTVLDTVPKVYKYIDCNGASNLISNSNILVRNPTAFNDPYDCHPHFVDFSNMPDDYLKGLVNKYYAHLSRIERRKIISKAIAGPKSDLIDRLNAERFDSERNTIGITCFSKSFDNILMWSQYADSHKGVCIGFDLAKLYLNVRESSYPETTLLQVIYKDTFDREDFFEDGFKAYTNWLRTKSQDWSYENEVRISFGPIDFQEVDCEFISFPKEAISEVYFGSMATTSNIQQISRLFGDSDIDLEFFKMQLSLNSFALEKVKIDA